MGNYKASNDTMKNYETFVQMINDCGWSGEEVLKLITDWHGNQLMEEEFIQNIIDCEL